MFCASTWHRTQTIYRPRTPKLAPLTGYFDDPLTATAQNRHKNQPKDTTRRSQSGAFLPVFAAALRRPSDGPQTFSDKTALFLHENSAVGRNWQVLRVDNGDYNRKNIV